MTKWLKLSFLTGLLLLGASSAFGQGSLYTNIAWRYTPAGAFPAGGATVTICTSTATGTPCTPTITVYSNSTLTTPVANPLPVCTTSPQFGCIDGLGNFSFYATPGAYTYTITGAGLSAYGPIPVGISCVAGVTCVTTSGNNAFTGNNTFGNINNILFVDGTKYATLASAVTACPSNGCLIFDTTPETFTADPFAGSSGKSIFVQFGAGVWIANYAPAAGSGAVNVKATQRIAGTGRVYGSTGGTIFRAGASLGANPVIKLDGTQGTRAENLTVDCNSVAGSTGIYATDINEQAGAFGITFTNCPAYGLNVDASAFTVIPAQNYSVRDIECYPQTAGSASTICARFKGNGGGGPEMVQNITASGAVGNVIGASVQIENFNQGIFQNIHGEESSKVLSLNGTTTCPSNINIINVSGGPSVAGGQNVVDIPTGCTGTGFSMHGITKNSATNVLHDVPRSITLTDAALTSYIVGPGALGSEEIYSTSPNVNKTIVGGPTFLGGVAFNGQITSTLAIGTAPFSITSTTPVANLTVQNCSTCTITGGSISPVNLLLNATAPTISAHFNTSGDSVSANNGTAAFTVTVGTGVAGSTGAVGLPTATTGWICNASNRNRGAYIQQTGSTTTSATFTNYGTTVGTPVNWSNSDVLAISCFAY